MDRMQPPRRVAMLLDGRGQPAHHRGMLRTLLVLGACAAAALAQGKTPPPRTRALVDAVIATVNDSPILLSELRTLKAGRLRTEEGRVTPQREAQIEQIELEKLLNKHRMAQAAKTFGDAPPEQIEQLLRRELERDKDVQVRELGSLSGLSRELARQGRTFSSYEQDLRTEKLYDFAEDIAVRRRLMRQTNLLVTPRMMREAYLVMRERFVHSASALVAQVRFTGADARKNAETAAAQWRKENLTARQLADLFPSGASAIRELSAAALAPELAPVAAFALAGPKDNVSDPIAFDGGFYVAKVTQFSGARDGKFEDPEVQAELRQMCEQEVAGVFRMQAYARARERTEDWISPLPH